MKKYVIAIIILFFVLAPGSNAKAFMPPVFPIYGYDAENNICKIKQLNATDDIRAHLSGDYWSLRECRAENPQIIFHTGSGILIWLVLLLLIIIFHYVVYPKFKKRSALEKRVFIISDILIIGLIIFFTTLLLHYFSVPRAFYNYGSDIDHIIYMTLIRGQVPAYYFFGYLILSSIKALRMYMRSKKK